MPLPDPTTAEIEELTLKIAHRLTAVLQRLCGDEFEIQELLAQTVAALQEALAVGIGQRRGGGGGDGRDAWVHFANTQA